MSLEFKISIDPESGNVNFGAENSEVYDAQAEINKAGKLEKFLEVCQCSHEEQERMAVKFNTPLRYENAISQLGGIAYAIAFDNVLSDDELKMLAVWLKHNAEFIEAWPISSVYLLFMDAVEYGEVTPEINSQLLKLLKNIGSNESVIDAIFDEVTDDDCFCDGNYMRTFVITGGFDSGHSRKEIGQMILDKGGYIHSDIRLSTEYLIVGSKGSKAWRFGKFGRKIEAAINNRLEHGNLKIIKESDFFKFVNKE